MTIVDCGTEMGKYHSDKVTLQKSDQDEMRKRRDAGRTRLEKGLERDGYPVPNETASQGSYAMRTMVQDAENDYDIDDGTYFKKDNLKDANGDQLTPYAARLRVCNALTQDDRLKHDAKVHRNCVRQAYPEGYHIDIPVYRIVTSTDKDGKTVTDYELASEDTWTKSDARGVTRWFNNIVGELNADENDGNQMRRVTRLTKKFARSRTKWKKNAPSGICLTKLVVECFVAQSGRDDAALLETWKAISDRLAESLKIEHPVLTGTILAAEGDDKVGFFQECLDDALEDLAVLDNQNCTKKKALSEWDKTFDTTFFSDQYVQENQPKRAAAVAGSLLSPAAVAGGLSFPNRPVVPNKPAGFA